MNCCQLNFKWWKKPRKKKQSWKISVTSIQCTCIRLLVIVFIHITGTCVQKKQNKTYFRMLETILQCLDVKVYFVTRYSKLLNFYFKFLPFVPAWCCINLLLFDPHVAYRTLKQLWAFFSLQIGQTTLHCLWKSELPPCWHFETYQLSLV